MSKIRALHLIIIDKNLEPNVANYNLVIKNNKIIHKLWHNCGSNGHIIEHNRQICWALLKSIIGQKLNIISQGLIVQQFTCNIIFNTQLCISPGLLCSAFYLLCFWVMPKKLLLCVCYAHNYCNYATVHICTILLSLVTRLACLQTVLL